MANKMTTVVLSVGMLALGAMGATTLSASAAPDDLSGDGVSQVDDCEQGRDGHRKRGKRGKRGGPGDGARIIRAVESLDLTADQQAAIDAIKADVEADRAERRAEMEGRRGERGQGWEAMLEAEQIDRAALHAELDERSAARNARAHDQLDTLLDVMEVLTVEQRAELADMAREKRAERGERHGPR